MKIIHISDLHIGKQMHGVSMLDSGDQKHWIERFLELVKEEKPDAVLICGDVYDRANPAREAVEAVSDFLSELCGLECRPAVMMIAGNHDSGPMVEYLRKIAEKQNVFLSGDIKKEARKVTLEDEFGPVDFLLMPYCFPAAVNQALGTEYKTYDEAFRAYISAQNLDPSRRNVILSHQNITAWGTEAVRGGSESMIGGVGGIDFSAFDDFEYAALGHIHAAQKVGRDEVRYAGSPLCYHFSELRRPDKGPVIVVLNEKGSKAEIRTAKIAPLHPLREVSGTFDEIVKKETGCLSRDEYIRVILKPGASGSFSLGPNADDQLRNLFKKNGSMLLDVEYDYASVARKQSSAGDASSSEKKTMYEEFIDFWKLKSSEPLSSDLSDLVTRIIGQGENSDRRFPAKIENLSAEEKDDLSEIVKMVKSLGGEENETV